MPATETERALLEGADIDYRRQRRERAPVTWQIGKWTVMALILNRTIGSGIFLLPQQVLAGAGCVGGALCLWALGAVISICGAYVWLECALSMPQVTVRGEVEPRGVPNSGGEKNFLEFMFPNSRLRLPHIRTTCSFAILYLVLYNLSGNAMAFAFQVLVASGNYQPTSQEPPSRGPVIGIAIAALSAVIILHTLSRRIGIWINNTFAIIKVALLLAIICLGIAKACGALGGSGPVARSNFTKDVWTRPQSHVSSWTDSLLLCLYSFSGFKQPFYVLVESRSPRKYFPKYVPLAVAITTVLFLLVNISYLLVVDKAEIIDKNGAPTDADMSTLFFNALFTDHSVKSGEKAARSMAAVIAVSIFGNLWVMAYSAARIKQEIAKEGILPKSLFFGAAYKTPFGLWQQYRATEKLPKEQIEHAPTAAFGLHWFTSILLIAAVSPIVDPRQAYALLVNLFTYAIVLVLGFWVSIGLIIVKLHHSKWHWQEGERRRYRPWLSPLHVIIYACATGFIAVAAFVPPGAGSIFQYSFASLPWYFVPVIGASAPAWGLLWYWGLLFYEWLTETRLEVHRERYCIPDPEYEGEYVQLGEIVDHWWPITSKDGLSDDFAQPGNGPVVERVRRADGDDRFELENGQGWREDERRAGRGADGEDRFELANGHGRREGERRARHGADGGDRFELENGQVWREDERRARRGPDGGDRFELENGRGRREDEMRARRSSDDFA